MTPSQAMLNDLRPYVEVSGGKVMANHYGAAEAADMDMNTNMDSSCPRGKESPIRLLYISLYAEHKNLTTLLEAIPLLNNDASGKKFVLATTVNPAWDHGSWTVTWKTDMQLAHREDVAPWVRFAGPLTPKETEEQYRCADIFVFPSLAESFGHPLVEAMAHGLPIVASDTPINREMCGDAAIYFRPLDHGHLAGAIRRVATNRQLQGRLSTAGRQRVRTKFNWQTHIRRILQVAQSDDRERLFETSEGLLPQPNEKVSGAACHHSRSTVLSGAD